MAKCVWTRASACVYACRNGCVRLWCWQVELAENLLSLEVIYGDTDSIMINTRCSDLAQVKRIGNQVKREVNKLYKTLEIDIDGVYKMMLLLKKKKYAALAVKEDAKGNEIGTVAEKKGLDLVRRDWCVLSRDVGSKVLDVILSGMPCEQVVEKIHAIMRKVAESVRADKLNLGQYVITKGMSKAPRDYPNVAALPHVQVALRLLKMGKHVNVGDHIPFVICLPEAASPPASSPHQVATPVAQGAGGAPSSTSTTAPSSPTPVNSAAAKSSGATPSPAARAAEASGTATSDSGAAGAGAGAGAGASVAASTPAPTTPPRAAPSSKKQGFAMRARYVGTCPPRRCFSTPPLFALIVCWLCHAVP